MDRKGVALQYRPDYSASPEAPETKIPEKAEITEAIWSSVNATGITLAAKAEKVNRRKRECCG
ncbi:hypothetical protein SBA3_470007 [Candidatus Sulfopaludibacter sp. SbA3]|nr:hypothetical protein SBA3_470007 [Candidatus Sulfopaludibacter sp. SbA3]